MIGGYVPGNPIDSIIVGYYQDGSLLYASKVRNGFVPHARRRVAAKLRGLELPPALLSIYRSESAHSGP